jgi:protein SCO1/2
MAPSISKKKFFFLSLFIIPSLLCLGFYYFAIRKPLSKGRTNIFVKLPHYGPATANGNNKDSVFFEIPSFEFVNQLNQELSTKSLEHKIYIIGVCDYNSEKANQVAAQLYRVQDKLSYLKKEFKIITVLNRVGNDTISNLLQFANKVHAEARIWNVVAGHDQELTQLFMQNSILSEKPESFVSNSTLLLVDRKNNIRGHYNGTSLKEVNRLIDEVMVLAAEYGKIKNM